MQAINSKTTNNTIYFLFIVFIQFNFLFSDSK